VGYLLAATGAALGSLARWGIAEAVPVPRGGWPWPTLVVNLVGCLLIGVLIGVLAVRRPHALWARTFLGAGVLGGFTTFSAFAVETVDLVRGGSVLPAAGYVAVSVAGGVLAVAIGVRSAQEIAGRR
jgi:CrcB protein